MLGGTIKLSCGNDVWQPGSLCIQKYTHFLLQRQSFEGSRVGCMELNPSLLVSFFPFVIILVIIIGVDFCNVFEI